MHERRRVARGSLDRNGSPTCRHVAGEADDSVGRCEHIASRCRTEVDAAVLARGVRVRTVEGEGTYDRPVDRPRPGVRGNGKSKRAQRDDTKTSKHEASFVVRFENRTTVARPDVCCQYWLQSTAVELVACRAGESSDHVGGRTPG